MATSKDLERLSDFFPEEDIEWRINHTFTRNGQEMGVALPYIKNRAIMERLDDVCGRHGWENVFRVGPNGGQLCRILIFVEDIPAGPDHGSDHGRWIGKEDGADNTDFQPVKGGLSGAMKRAAVQWGIGRYLYEMPNQTVRVEKRGNKTRMLERPRVPQAYLPGGSGKEEPKAEEPKAKKKAQPKKDPALVDAAYFNGELLPVAESKGYTEDELRDMIKKQLGARPKKEDATTLVVNLVPRGDGDEEEPEEDDIFPEDLSGEFE